MGNKKKPLAWILFGIYFMWELVLQPVWNLNVERVAEESKFDTTLAGFAPVSALSELAAYLPNSFAAGFVAGGLIFAYWDTIIDRWRRLRGEKPLSELRGWIGNMVPIFDPEKRHIDLWVSLINVGLEGFRVKGATGTARITATGGKVFDLSNPRLLAVQEETYERGMYSSFAVRFEVPPRFWQFYPEIFRWTRPRTYFRVGDFRIVLEGESGARKEMSGWDSIRMTVGEEDVRSVETLAVTEEQEQGVKILRDISALGKIMDSISGPRSPR